MNRRQVRMAGLALLLSASVATAQQIWVGRGRDSFMGPRFPKAEDFDGRFMYCRVFFRGPGRGGGWRTDYPGADNNFSVRLAELTRVDVKFDADRQPHHIVVSLVGSAAVPLSDALPGEPRERVLLSRGGAASAHLPAERRAAVGGRCMGIVRVGALDGADWPRAAARVVPDPRHPDDSSDHAHALRREGDPAGAGDQLLGRHGRADVGARRRQCAGLLQGAFRTRTAA